MLSANRENISTLPRHKVLLIVATLAYVMMTLGGQVKSNDIWSLFGLILIPTTMHVIMRHFELSDTKKLLLIGSVVTTFLVLTTNYTYPGGAGSFFAYANALVTGQPTPDIVQRDIGFPLVILLSGYLFHHSLFGIVLIHAVMAVLIPLLCYDAVQHTSKKAAYLAGLACIFSLAPYYFIKWIHHDQVYVFFTVLSMSLLMRFIHQPRSVYLYALTAAGLAASLTRPAANPLLILFLMLAWYYGRGKLGRYILCAIVAVAVIGAYGMHRRHMLDPNNTGSMPSYTGQQLFYNPYINAKEFGITLSPDLGPHMKGITDKAYAAALPNLRQSALMKALSEPEGFLQKYVYPYSPEEFMQEIFNKPNYEYFSYLSIAAPDREYIYAMLEIFKAYPWYPFAYTYRNTVKFLVDPGFNHPRFTTEPFARLGKYTAYTLAGNDSKEYADISTTAVKEVSYDYRENSSRVVQFLNHLVKVVVSTAYPKFVWLLFGLMCVAWGVFVAGIIKPSIKQFAVHANPSIVSLSVILMVSILIHSAFVEPDFRYHHFMLPLKIMLACVGLGLLFRAKNKVN